MAYRGLNTMVVYVGGSRMSSRTAVSAPPRTTKSGSKTDGRFRSDTRHPRWSGSRAPVPVGTRFGSLVITSAQMKRVDGYRMVRAKCELSGIEKWTSWDNLHSGKATSFLRNGKRPFGYPGIIRRMDEAKRRCTLPSHRYWHRYGGRGIEFRFASPLAAARWVVSNLGPPAPKMEIDRINNDGHYEPGNLRWATRKQQIANRSMTY